MRHRESVYGFNERYCDLNRTYKAVLSQGNYNTQEEAMAAAVNMPSKRFWVSEERLVEVINALENGKDFRVSRKSPRHEMFQELYRRYLDYKSIHPGLTKMEICSEIIYQPAPKFYMRPSWGLKILYRGRNGQLHKLHSSRNPVRTNNEIPKERKNVRTKEQNPETQTITPNES